MNADLERQLKEAEDFDPQAEIKEAASAGVRDQAGALQEVGEGDLDFPDMFVDPEKRIRVEVLVLFDPSTGKANVVASKPNALDNVELQHHKKHVYWFEFTQPTYEQMAAYRRTGMQWDDQRQRFLVDPISLRMHYLRFHLKDWNVSDSKGNVIELVFDGDMLERTCFERIMKVSPVLMDVVLTAFEERALLS